MSLIVLCLAVGAAVSAEPPRSPSDKEIRQAATRIAKIAAKEPPTMAADSLLQAAVLVQPYLPTEAQRLYRQHLQSVERRPDLRVSSTMVKHWMTLDPTGAEGRILGLKQRRRAREALISYYERQGERERSATLASAVIRTAREGALSEERNLRIIAAVRPLEAQELFELLRRDPQAQPGLLESALGLLDGLGRTLETQPQAVRAVLDWLVPVLADPEFGKNARVLIPGRVRVGEQAVETKDSRATLLLTAALLERQLDPGTAVPAPFLAWSSELRRVETPEAARKALGSRVLRYEIRRDTRSENRPPPLVSLDLPVAEALAELRKREPARTRLAELFRYLTLKPRSEAELGQIVSTLVEWAQQAPAEADPYWFLESPLNLDGRLRPGGKPWRLSAPYRPAVFHAAARTAQRLDLAPDRLAGLVQAMRREKIPLPPGVPSAEARARIEDLRNALEERYDFTLPAPEGPPRRLKAERGKVVALNFWATWCGPCREEMPALRKVYESLRQTGLEVFAITDESPAAVRSFLAKNPLGIPVLLDEKGLVFDHYGVQGRPQTFVLDRAGRIASHLDGPQTEDQLRAAVAQALR